MTAPAEDPRGGECSRCRHRPHTGVCGYLPDDEVEPYRCQCTLHTAHLPAAGRGDTDSGGECRHVGKAGLDCDCQPAPPAAARPAGDRAQPTQELREQLEQMAAHKIAYVNAPQLWGRSKVVDAVLALPAVAALLDAQAAVNKARVLIDHPGLPDATCRKLIRRALDGTT